MSALAKINHAERRQHKRFAVIGGLPAQLSRQNGDVLRILIQDLSKDGLGVVLTTPVKKLERVSLHWHQDSFEPVAMRVVWVRAIDDDGGAIYHCGLQTSDRSVDLEMLARGSESVTLDELD